MSSDLTGASGLEGRYATALFELSDEEKQLDQVAKDLNTIGMLLNESEDLRRLIRSPVISREDQQKAMQALLDKVNIGQLTCKFIGVTVDNRRLFSLPAMIKGYFALLAKARGEAKAEVVSAKPLSDAQLNAIVGALKQTVGSKVGSHPCNV